MALIFEAETYEILGACFEAYREKGCGFLEDVCQECLEIEWHSLNLTLPSVYSVYSVAHPSQNPSK
jgi:hypothetical protein